MSTNEVINNKVVKQCFFDFDAQEVKEEIISVEEKIERSEEDFEHTTYHKSKLDEITRKTLFENNGECKRYTSFLSGNTIILDKNPNGNGYRLISEEVGEDPYVQKFQDYTECLENFEFWVETIDDDHL